MGFCNLTTSPACSTRIPPSALVELSNNGEIFLNPMLLEVLRIAYARGVAVQAMNGAHLNSVRDEVLEGVVKYGLTTITCSIDGASQETYQRYRGREISSA